MLRQASNRAEIRRYGELCDNPDIYTNSKILRILSNHITTRLTDPYKWAKRRITAILQEMNPLMGDIGIVSPGQLWSIKKLLALDYYISATRPIFQKYFDELYYVDTHCGSGLIGFDDSDKFPPNVRFPGSPLIALSHHLKKPFSGYYVSDDSKDMIDTLKNRIDAITTQNITLPIVRSFAETVEMVKGIERWSRAFVVFVDPRGYKELLWRDVDKLLSIDKADVFITFMSYAMGLSLPHARTQDSTADTFNGVFGTSGWRSCHNQDDLVSLYMNRIKTRKQYVAEIPIFRTGESRLYHMIFASGNSAGAGRVMDDIKQIMDVTTTEMLTDALRVTSANATDLDAWM